MPPLVTVSVAQPLQKLNYQNKLKNKPRLRCFKRGLLLVGSCD